MWKSDRKEVDVKWDTHVRHWVFNWFWRFSNNNTDWKRDREKHATHKRDYMLWSFFESILTAILDPKDWYALRIKSNPDYEVDSADFNSRVENNNTQWRKIRI